VIKYIILTLKRIVLRKSFSPIREKVKIKNKIIVKPKGDALPSSQRIFSLILINRSSPATLRGI